MKIKKIVAFMLIFTMVIAFMPSATYAADANNTDEMYQKFKTKFDPLLNNADDLKDFLDIIASFTTVDDYDAKIDNAIKELSDEAKATLQANGFINDAGEDIGIEAVINANINVINGEYEVDGVAGKRLSDIFDAMKEDENVAKAEIKKACKYLYNSLPDEVKTNFDRYGTTTDEKAGVLFELMTIYNEGDNFVKAENNKIKFCIPEGYIDKANAVLAEKVLDGKDPIVLKNVHEEGIGVFLDVASQTINDEGFDTKKNLQDICGKLGIWESGNITKPSSGGGGSGGGGGGGGSSRNTKIIRASSGGSFEKYGATIEIPKNAFDFDSKIEIEIKKVSDTSKLTIPEKMKLASNVVEITKNKEGDFKKPFKVTLEYDKDKFDADKYDLAIYWLDEEKDEKDEWNKLDNISVDKEKGTVSGEVNHFTKFAVLALEKEATEKPEEPTTALTDIKGHWAEENIAKLILDGAISGYPDKTFKPNNNITRAEFATVLVKAFKLENKAGKVFTDTKYHWAKDFIATAAANGIVSGYGENTFGPDDLITREQMAVMIAKVAELGDTDKAVTFTDSKSISNWAKSAVASAAEAKIISGYPDGTFKPQGKATRAEAVTVIVKSMEK